MMRVSDRVQGLRVVRPDVQALAERFEGGVRPAVLREQVSRALVHDREILPLSQLARLASQRDPKSAFGRACGLSGQSLGFGTERQEQLLRCVEILRPQ